MIFWYNEDNHYDSVGGVMKYFPYILFFFYVIVFIILFSTRFSELHHRDRKGVIYGIIMATLGVLINVVAKLEVDYSTLFASVLLVYYLFLYVNYPSPKGNGLVTAQS